MYSAATTTSKPITHLCDLPQRLHQGRAYQIFVTAKLQQTVSRNTPKDTVREEPNSNIKDSAENVNENTKSSFMWCEE